MSIKALIACEESQRVCIEFRKIGIEAYSCDIIDCSGGHPEWHIKTDVLPILNGGCTFTTTDGVTHAIQGKWDIIIAFPPCTDLCASGAAWFEKKRANGNQQKSIEFFMRFINADCERIVIENPVGIISGSYIPKWYPSLAENYNLPIKYTQKIQPWQFGDNYSKTTCLWLKGVKPLEAIVTAQPELEWFEWVDSKTGKKKRQPKWFADAFKLSPADRAKTRSRTFPGIAKAMAEQWGIPLITNKEIHKCLL